MKKSIGVMKHMSNRYVSTIKAKRSVKRSVKRSAKRSVKRSSFPICLQFGVESEDKRDVVANELTEPAKQLLERVIRDSFVESLRGSSGVVMTIKTVEFTHDDVIIVKGTVPVRPEVEHYGQDLYSWIEMIDEKSVTQLITHQIEKDSYPNDRYFAVSNNRKINISSVGICP
jgi:hypothetical protein